MPTGSAHGRETPVPAFYDSKQAREWDYAPNQQAVFEAANDFRRAHGLRPASDDALKVHLVLVDVQKDFCFPRGSLYVGGRSGTGAMDDSDRIARFIYRNAGAISEITCTMDTHFPFQIFFPSFWVDADGKPLQPYRDVTAEQVRAGEALPNPAISAWVSGGDYEWLRRQAEFYCEELEREGKYRLYLWPLHCLAGSDGHPLAGVIHEARLFHAFARSARNGVEIKGGHPLTENYSVLSPEVLTRFDGGALAARNADFIKTLLEADLVVVAGQAASHCVKSTIEDLLNEVRDVDESLVRKVVILQDCMSAVTVPDPLNPGAFLADYTPDAEAALARFAAAGMRVAKSTDPVEGWLAGVV